MSVRAVLVPHRYPIDEIEVVSLDGDLFDSVKKVLGNPRVIGMAPKLAKNRLFEFWYDDTGDQFEDDNQNRAMEMLLGGGFYGPGVLLERKRDDDRMRVEDYGDIVAGWDGSTSLFDYLCELM
jgi:hypothetical protein